MILAILGVPSYIEPGWPYKTESWIFCTDPLEIEELKSLKTLLPRKDWRAKHCPPHWRLTEAEARQLPFPIIDSLSMTLHCRTWRRHINHHLTLPKPRSHRKKSGTTGDEP